MSLPQTAKIHVPIEWLIRSPGSEPVPVINLEKLIDHARQGDNLIGSEELAARMKVSRSTVNMLVQRRRITPLLADGKHLFHYPSVIEQLKETAK